MMRLSFFRTARLFGAGLLLLSGLVAAQNISISPTALSLSEDRQVGTFTLSNRGDRQTTVHARVWAWSQEDGEDRLSESNELLLSPPIFTLEPGESQVVRTGLRHARGSDREASYRVTFREVRPDDRVDASVGLQMTLEISVPVFIAASRPVSANLDWQLRYDHSAEEAVVRVENQGGAHARLTRIGLMDAESDELLARPGRQLVYLLPGTDREWRIPLDGEDARRAVLKAEGRSGSDRIDVSLALE